MKGLDEGDAQPVVQGEPVDHLPGVLAIEFEVLVGVVGQRVFVDLLIAQKIAEQGVGEGPVGVARVVGVAAEIDSGVVRLEGVLGLHRVLIVDSGLDGVGAHDLGDVVDVVPDRIAVGVGSAGEAGHLGAVDSGSAEGNAAEIEIRNHSGDVGIRDTAAER